MHSTNKVVQNALNSTALNAVARNSVMLPAEIQGACAMWRRNVKNAWVAAKNCDLMADTISKWFAGLSAEDKKRASKLIEQSIAPMAAERSFLRKAWGVIEF